MSSKGLQVPNDGTRTTEGQTPFCAKKGTAKAIPFSLARSTEKDTGIVFEKINNVVNSLLINHLVQKFNQMGDKQKIICYTIISVMKWKEEIL